MINANEKRLKKLQKKLAREYQKSEKEIKKELDAYLSALEQADGLESQKLADGLITEEQYKAWRQMQVQSSEWSRRVTNALAKILVAADIVAISNINKATTAVAVEGSTFAQFEASRIVGKTFSLVNKNAIEVALKEKLYKKVNVARDMLWNERQVRSVISQALLNGWSVPKTANKLLDAVGTYYKKEDIKNWYDLTERQITREIARKNRIASLRDARTMLNSAEQQGKLAEYRMLKEMGVDIQKGWLAVLDERTRDTHAEIDMEFVEIEDTFSNGLMEPCDPDGDPSEVYNCRCTLISKIDGKTISLEERRNKLERSYEEWHSR